MAETSSAAHIELTERAAELGIVSQMMRGRKQAQRPSLAERWLAGLRGARADFASAKESPQQAKAVSKLVADTHASKCDKEAEGQAYEGVVAKLETHNGLSLALFRKAVKACC